MEIEKFLMEEQNIFNLNKDIYYNSLDLPGNMPQPIKSMLSEASDNIKKNLYKNYLLSNKNFKDF